MYGKIKTKTKQKKLEGFFYQHKAWSQSEFVSNYQLFVDDDISPAREDQEWANHKTISMTSEVPRNTRWVLNNCSSPSKHWLHESCMFNKHSKWNTYYLQLVVSFKVWRGFILANECEWKIGDVEKKCKKLKGLGTCAVLISKHLPPSLTLPQWFMNERHIARVSGNPKLYWLFSQRIFLSDNFLENFIL